MENIVVFNPCYSCDEKKCSMCELNMYREGTLVNNKWISVEDRLPDETGKYLVCTKLGNVYQTKYYEGRKWGQKDKGKSITHWMPLPEATKMKKEEQRGG